MFQSLASRFPDPINRDFFEFDKAGDCFVAFSAYERGMLHVEEMEHICEPVRLVIFFDNYQRNIASIYIHYDSSTDTIIQNDDIGYDHATEEMLMGYMMEFYPDIAEYLLWCL